MSILLKSVVEWLKAIAYLAVTVSAGYTYLNKDAILSQVADELKPYIETQVEESVKEFVPIAVVTALQSEEMHLKVDSSQFRLFTILLNANKQEILEASANTAEKIAKMVLHNFLVVERDIVHPITKEQYRIKGILIGKDELGRDEWIFSVKEIKLN